MRAALALPLLVAMLAGCTQGDPGDGGTSAFQPSCPAWRQGLSRNIFESMFHQNSTETGPREDEVAYGPPLDDGHPLDKVVLDFNDRRLDDGGVRQQGVYAEDSRLRLSAKADDDGRALLLYDPSRGPRSAANPGVATWTFEPGTLHEDFQLQVDLVEPADEPKPTSVTLVWDWERDLDGNDETRHGAHAAYTAYYLYRTC